MRKTLIQWRRGIAAEWANENPVLAAGEPGLETDTGKVKVGNGYHVWTDLSYLVPSGAGTISDTTAIGSLSVDASSTSVLTADSGGTLVRRLALGATGRSLLGAADGAALRAILGSGTADNTTLLDGSGAWVAKSSITTTDASLLTSGTLADARLSSNVPLLNAANTFTAGPQSINYTAPLGAGSLTAASARVGYWGDYTLTQNSEVAIAASAGN